MCCSLQASSHFAEIKCSTTEVAALYEKKMAQEDVFDCKGKTTNGEAYASISAMWEGELSCASSSGSESWYSKSEDYWDNQKASVEGMLGGLQVLHMRDVAASREFYSNIPNITGERVRALDVGAGIGRVSKSLLLPLFESVDMLEQNLKYVEESKSFLANGNRRGNSKVGRRIACSMQAFKADGVMGRDGVSSGSLRGNYDVIWIQWCVIYLTDDHFASFLIECSQCLAPRGVIVIKDNVANSGFLVDKDDSSVMRSDPYLRHVFTRANLNVVSHARQLDFPRTVYPVRMYALRPTDKMT